MYLQLHGEEALKKQSKASLRKGIGSFQKQILEHQHKQAHPEQYYSEWGAYEDWKRQGLLEHWQKEIDNFKESIETRVIELKERGEYERTDKR